MDKYAGKPMSLALDESVRLPLTQEVLPGGLRFGSNYLVLFEPQSLWYDTSITLAAQGLKAGYKTDYHTFTHTPGDLRTGLSRQGLDIGALEHSDVFRIWDSYTVQGGIDKSPGVSKANSGEDYEPTSLKIADWGKEEAKDVQEGYPEVDLERLHIDDNTSVLLHYNTEKEVLNHYRTVTLQHARKAKLCFFHSLVAGIYTESFYREFESFCDGIVDFKAQEVDDKVVQLMRVRVIRGTEHDSSWRRLGTNEEGGVFLRPRIKS